MQIFFHFVWEEFIKTQYCPVKNKTGKACKDNCNLELLKTWVDLSPIKTGRIAGNLMRNLWQSAAEL